MLDWLEDFLLAPCAGPCFNCHAGKVQKSQPLRSLKSAGSVTVELAVSPIGGLRGFGGYHTSVLIAGEEYYFSPSGIHCCTKVYSHPEEVMRIFIGHSSVSGAELLSFLGDQFKEGSYDLLRKNYRSNAFTDCALYFLCEQRLDLRYRAVEKLAWMADDRTGILQSLSNGEYSPNPLAEDFDLEAILQDIDLAREWDSDSVFSEDFAFEEYAEDGYVAQATDVELCKRWSKAEGLGEEMTIQRL